MQVISARLGKETKDIPDDAMEKLTDYTWPGNIRELENVIERSVIISRGNQLMLPDLEPLKADIRDTQKLEGDLKTVEKVAIENALMKTDGNRKKAAEMLGISLRALQYKIKEYGIS